MAAGAGACGRGGQCAAAAAAGGAGGAPGPGGCDAVDLADAGAQGVLFVGQLPEPRPLSLTPGCLILDGLQDPGNLGTILRTADALEIPVILSSGCADPYSAKTVRASMGAIFRTPPQMGEPQAVLDACRAQKIPLAVTALSHQAVDIRQGNPAECAVVIGSEGRGVSAAFLQAAQRQLIIPMHPRCESLNAAIAAAIVMWQMRQ